MPENNKKSRIYGTSDLSISFAKLIDGSIINIQSKDRSHQTLSHTAFLARSASPIVRERPIGLSR